jgi:hypothetical protein
MELSSFQRERYRRRQACRTLLPRLLGTAARYHTYSELLAATDLVIEKELGTDVKDGQVPPPPTGHQGADRLPAGHRAKRDTRPAFSMCTAV